MKRVFDIVVAALNLLLLLPLMAAIAVVVMVSLGRPILFRHRRAGLHGRPFELIKFRTMLDRLDIDGNVLPDVDRVTRAGRFLRSTSLDELPELVNVLRGEMSLVGPRPLEMHYIERYSPEQARRHEVMPGITGWAQINGRNAITWEERFRLDVWYVDHWSFSLDLRILATTPWKVLRRQGIKNAASEVNMPEFMGSK